MCSLGLRVHRDVGKAHVFGKRSLVYERTKRAFDDTGEGFVLGDLSHGLERMRDLELSAVPERKREPGSSLGFAIAQDAAPFDGTGMQALQRARL